MSLFARKTHPRQLHGTLRCSAVSHALRRFLVTLLIKPWHQRTRLTAVPSHPGSWSPDSQNLGKTALPVLGHPTRKTLAIHTSHRRFLVNLFTKPCSTHRTTSQQQTRYNFHRCLHGTSNGSKSTNKLDIRTFRYL